MGRPEKTITTGVRELAALAEHLRRLRTASGKTYPELERAGGYSASVFSRAASGDSLPTWQVTSAYGAACGADPDTLRTSWERARDALDRQRSSAGAEAEAPGSPTDFNLRLRDLIRQTGTQRAVASRANYSPSTVSAALNATRVPSREFTARVLASLDLPAAEITRWQSWRATLAAGDATPAAPVAAPELIPGQSPAPGDPGPPHGAASPAGSGAPLRAVVGLLPILLAALLLTALFTLLPAVVDRWISAC